MKPILWVFATFCIAFLADLAISVPSQANVAQPNESEDLERTKRASRTGQTQSQYLNFGDMQTEGKADAEITRYGSRASVSGANGMGQAQSQSSGTGCDECYDSNNGYSSHGSGGSLVADPLRSSTGSSSGLPTQRQASSNIPSAPGYDIYGRPISGGSNIGNPSGYDSTGFGPTVGGRTPLDNIKDAYGHGYPGSTHGSQQPGDYSNSFPGSTATDQSGIHTQGIKTPQSTGSKSFLKRPISGGKTNLPIDPITGQPSILAGRKLPTQSYDGGKIVDVTTGGTIQPGSTTLGKTPGALPSYNQVGGDRSQPIRSGSYDTSLTGPDRRTGGSGFQPIDQSNIGNGSPGYRTGGNGIQPVDQSNIGGGSPGYDRRTGGSVVQPVDQTNIEGSPGYKTGGTGLQSITPSTEIDLRKLKLPPGLCLVRCDTVRPGQTLSADELSGAFSPAGLPPKPDHTQTEKSSGHYIFNGSPILPSQAQPGYPEYPQVGTGSQAATIANLPVYRAPGLLPGQQPQLLGVYPQGTGSQYPSSVIPSGQKQPSYTQYPTVPQVQIPAQPGGSQFPPTAGQYQQPSAGPYLQHGLPTSTGQTSVGSGVQYPSGNIPSLGQQQPAYTQYPTTPQGQIPIQTGVNGQYPQYPQGVTPQGPTYTSGGVSQSQGPSADGYPQTQGQLPGGYTQYPIGGTQIPSVLPGQPQPGYVQYPQGVLAGGQTSIGGGSLQPSGTPPYISGQPQGTYTQPSVSSGPTGSIPTQTKTSGQYPQGPAYAPGPAGVSQPQGGYTQYPTGGPPIPSLSQILPGQTQPGQYQPTTGQTGAGLLPPSGTPPYVSGQAQAGTHQQHGQQGVISGLLAGTIPQTSGQYLQPGYQPTAQQSQTGGQYPSTGLPQQQSGAVGTGIGGIGTTGPASNLIGTSGLSQVGGTAQYTGGFGPSPSQGHGTGTQGLPSGQYLPQYPGVSTGGAGASVGAGWPTYQPGYGQTVDGYQPGYGQTYPGEQGPANYYDGHDKLVPKLGEGEQIGGGEGGSISTGDGDGFSQAESSIKNGEVVASAQGTKNGGTAQTQVQGTYSGTGSFSASAQTADKDRSAQAQVSGHKDGALSSSQGSGGKSQAQAQVEVNEKTGGTSASGQSSGLQHSSQSEVTANEKGGLADAQSSGPGQTSSQAQIGFRPESSATQSQGSNIFNGGGQASAQSGVHSGLSQSQIQGSFKYGISYHGAAQAASGTKEQVTSYREKSKKLFQSIGQFTRSNRDAVTSSPVSDIANINDIGSKPKPPQYAQDETPEDGVSLEDADYENDEGDDEYEENDDTTDKTKKKSNTKKSRMEVELPQQNVLDETPGKSKKTDSVNVIISTTQATPFSQTTTKLIRMPVVRSEIVPDGFKGKIDDKRPKNNLTSSKNRVSNNEAKVDVKPDTYVTVTNSISGSIDNAKTTPNDDKKFESTYYTKSSTCGYFTFSCNIVYGSNGRSKICRPKTPTNGKC